MPIGAIAAGVAKIGVTAGRTAVSVGTKAVKTGAKIAKEGAKARTKIAKKGAEVAQKGVKTGVKRTGNATKKTLEKGKKLNDQRKKFQERHKEAKNEQQSEQEQQPDEDEDEEETKKRKTSGSGMAGMAGMKGMIPPGMKGGYMSRNLREPKAKNPIGMKGALPPSLKSSPFLKGAGQKKGGTGMTGIKDMLPPDMKGGYMSRRRDGRSQANGMRMSDKARSQAMMRRQMGTGQPGQKPSKQEPRVPGEATKEELKKRDAREDIFEYFIQSSGMAMRALDFGTVGVGLLATFIPRMLILGRKNHQMLYGDIICKGKNKYFGGLEYRGALSVLKYLDTSRMGLKLMVILSDLLLVIMLLIVLSGMMLIVVAIASPTILLAIGLDKLLGGI